jgi:hypothetical protein
VTELERARESERDKKPEMYILVDIIDMHTMVFRVQMHTIQNWRLLVSNSTATKALSHLQKVSLIS